MKDVVSVDLGARSYDIVIGPGLIDGIAALLEPHLKRPRVAIVTEDTVAGHHFAGLIETLAAAEIDAVSLCLPPGEGTKSWPYLTRVVEWFLAEKIERNDLVIALGGGVIGDLVGFAASVTRRGVRFVQVPTSLLAQVDSSVGGKTAINSEYGKNLVGAFYQPSLVVADTALLNSLSTRDFLSGYGEVVKYGLLGDLAFFEWLEHNGKALLLREQTALVAAVKRSCEMKADIVKRDETELGDRALLNLGHTFCHALETATGYSDRLLHGEGVAVGCVLAFETSARLGLCSQEDPVRLRAHLAGMGMKTTLAEIGGDLPPPDALWTLMGQDKKVIDGTMRFVMVRGIGEAFVTSDVPRDTVLDILSDSAAGL